MRSASAPYNKALPLKNAVNRLLEVAPFNHCAQTDALFLAALKETAAVHLKNSPHFSGIWKDEGFCAADLKSIADIYRMPFIGVNVFKERSLSSAHEKDIVLELTSSGTGGQKSRMLLDKLSLLRVRRLAWQVFNGLGMADLNVKANSLCFTYDPAIAKNLGTAFTDELITGLTKRGEVFYAIKWDKEKKDFYFDKALSVNALKRFEESGLPARIIGFPAHALMICEEFKKTYGRAAKLNKNSFVITGGGWKDLQDKAVDKQIMRAQIAKGLGLNVGHVRDLFGMVEHGVPYVDCALGNFHVPVYGKIIVRDAETLKPLPYGSKGLMQFITPYNTSYPSMSVLAYDYGVLHEKCPCGLKGDIMEIAGRAGVSKQKGCAVAAGEML